MEGRHESGAKGWWGSPGRGGQRVQTPGSERGRVTSWDDTWLSMTQVQSAKWKKRPGLRQGGVRRVRSRMTLVTC